MPEQTMEENERYCLTIKQEPRSDKFIICQPRYIDSDSLNGLKKHMRGRFQTSPYTPKAIMDVIRRCYGSMQENQISKDEYGRIAAIQYGNCTFEVDRWMTGSGKSTLDLTIELELKRQNRRREFENRLRRKS